MDFDRHEDLRERRLRSVYGHSAGTLALTLLMAPYIAWRVHEIGGVGQAIWIWWAGISILALMRLGVSLAFHRMTQARHTHRIWEWWYMAGAAVMGLAWGWLAWGMPQLSLTHSLLLMTALISIIAASLMSHAHHLASFLAFCTPVSISMAFGASQWPPETHWNAYSIVFFTWAILALVGKRLSDSFAMLVHAQFDAEAARHEAQQASAARSRFLAQMSHEIRTPINGMMGMAQLMRNLELPIPAPGYVRAILDSGRRLLGVVNDVLDYSKAESGRLKLIVQDVEIRPWLEELCLTYRSASERKGLRFTVRVDAAVPDVVSVDPQRLGQILSNLLDNAVKYTDQGCIGFEVDYQAPLQQLQLRIEDTGVGMSERASNEVFKPFVQADSAGERLRGGTGLGLAIVAQLVELHGGSMRLHSRLGEGSRFEIDLPAPTAALTERLREPSISLRGKRILVVDDVALNLELVKAMIEHLGAQPLTARDGEEAIAAHEQYDPDLVLMDCQMPVLDGLEACRRIRRSQTATRQCPIVALSAFTEQQHRDECLHAGMDECLAKPVDFYQLKETVERLIHEHAARANNPTP